MFARLTGLLLFTLVLTSPVLSDDWPQWRGPHRNGKSAETKLLKTWPEGGPKLMWTYEDAGTGFSSPAIVGDKLFCMGTREKDTFLYCLDSKSGKEVWSTKVGPTFQDVVKIVDGKEKVIKPAILGWGGGPRSGPTVDGDYVYGLTAGGILTCVTAADGKEVWSVDFYKDLGGNMMSGWGYSESILIDGDRLICTPGSQSKGTFAAYDKKTGKVIWMSEGLKNKATYSSLMKVNFGDVPQYLGLSYDTGERSVVASGIAVKDGKVLWTHSLDSGDIDFAACSPLIEGDQAFLSIGDGSVGAYMLQVTKNGDAFQVKDLYEDVRRNMYNEHGGTVLVDGHIYGYSKVFNTMCLEWKSGDKVWFNRPAKLPGDSAAICYANGQLYLYSADGEAALVEASSEGWDEKGRFKIAKTSTPPAESRARKIWTHPVIANGRLYLRDNEYLFCYDISAK